MRKPDVVHALALFFLNFSRWQQTKMQPNNYHKITCKFSTNKVLLKTWCSGERRVGTWLGRVRRIIAWGRLYGGAAPGMGGVNRGGGGQNSVCSTCPGWFAPKLKSFEFSCPYLQHHIGRAVRFVDFIARFSTDIVYFSYRSSHLSLPIFVTDKSCL